MPDPILRAGYADADITPPLGGSMPGYFKDRQATGILDPLRAKAVFLAGGGESVAVVGGDPLQERSVRTNPGRHNPNVVRPAGEIDPRVHVLRLEAARFLVVIYGCHPDVVGGTQYSADYPHHLTETLQHALGAEWRVLF